MYFVGLPMKEFWDIPELMLDDTDDPLGMFINFARSVALSPRVPNELISMLEPYGEFLPLNVAGEQYYAFNVTNLIDAFDEANAVMKVHKGIVCGVTKYAYTTSLLKTSQFFKAKMGTHMTLLAADFPGEEDFKQVYEKLGATGLQFNLMQSDQQSVATT